MMDRAAHRNKLTTELDRREQQQQQSQQHFSFFPFSAAHVAYNSNSVFTNPVQVALLSQRGRAMLVSDSSQARSQPSDNGGGEGSFSFMDIFRV